MTGDEYDVVILRSNRIGKLPTHPPVCGLVYDNILLQASTPSVGITEATASCEYG